MRKSILALSTALIVVLPSAVSAQGFGVAGRVGTLGVGGEVALGLTSAFVIRGGAGVSPFEPSVTINDVDVTLKLPQWYNVGADLYLGGSFRIGGGMLFMSCAIWRASPTVYIASPPPFPSGAPHISWNSSPNRRASPRSRVSLTRLSLRMTVIVWERRTLWESGAGWLNSPIYQHGS